MYVLHLLLQFSAVSTYKNITNELFGFKGQQTMNDLRDQLTFGNN